MPRYCLFVCNLGKVGLTSGLQSKSRLVPLCFSTWTNELQHRHYDLLEAQLFGSQEHHEVELSGVASRIRSSRLGETNRGTILNMVRQERG